MSLLYFTLMYYWSRWRFRYLPDYLCILMINTFFVNGSPKRYANAIVKGHFIKEEVYLVLQ